MRYPQLLARCLSAIFAASASLAQADERETVDYQISTTIQAVSDLRTRGTSDSLMQPAAKLSVLLAHRSGLIGLLDVAGVSQTAFPHGNGTDVTLAGGYRFGDPEGWHYGVGLATEMFSGSKFNAPHNFDMSTGTPGGYKDTNYDSQFAVLEIGYGAIEGRILSVLSDTYRGADTGGVCGAMLQYDADPTRALQCYARGDHNSSGSLLFDLDYKVQVAPNTKVTLHLGHQSIVNFSEADMTDYMIGVTRKQWGFDWTLNWVNTEINAPALYIVQDGNTQRRIDNSTVVFSVSKSF